MPNSTYNQNTCRPAPKKTKRNPHKNQIIEMNTFSKDIHRHIQSFMTIEDYWNSKLYFKDTECNYQEDKIKLFKQLFDIMPNRYPNVYRVQTNMNKRIIYENFIKYNKMEFYCYENFLQKELKKKICKLTKQKITFFRNKSASPKNGSIYHFLIWK